MLRGIMANIDVKLGVKSILSRVESAYQKRNEVVHKILKITPDKSV